MTVCCKLGTLGKAWDAAREAEERPVSKRDAKRGSGEAKRRCSAVYSDGAQRGLKHDRWI